VHTTVAFGVVPPENVESTYMLIIYAAPENPLIPPTIVASIVTYDGDVKLNQYTFDEL
jgi:hypothetical protein